MYNQVVLVYSFLVATMLAFGVNLLATLLHGKPRQAAGFIAAAASLVVLALIWTLSFPVVIAGVLSLLTLANLIEAARIFAARFNGDNTRYSSPRRDIVFTLVLFVAVFVIWFNNAVILLSLFEALDGGDIGHGPLLVLGLLAYDGNTFFPMVLLVLVLVFGVYGIFRYIFARTHFAFWAPRPAPESSDLPSLTLAIPARNETEALAECLMTATASTYEKLEIVVLDDCSQDKTSDIIRSFAHDGVRFIQGELPASGWLGRNYALEQLTASANGDYIAFMNVDTRLSPDTLSLAMDALLTKNVDMISVLPRQKDSFRFGAVLEPLRYFWQVLMPPNEWRTPTASSFWIIKNDTLHELGGLESQKYKVLPENGFARRLIPKMRFVNKADTELNETKGDASRRRYHFFIASTVLGLYDTKPWGEAVEASTRMLYPVLHRRPLEVVGDIAIHLILVTPYVLIFVNQFFGLALVAIVALSLLAMLYASLVRKSWLLAPLMFPLQLVQEIIIAVATTVKYEFGRVDWKGRNICFPVMRPEKKLH